MRHLPLPSLDKKIKRVKRIFLFLDYDGTLTPIVKRPQDAKLSPSVRGILKDIAEKERYILGIISGREIREVMKLVGIKGIIYVGNHGLEVYDGEDIRLIEEEAVRGYMGLLREIRKCLKKGLTNFQGLLLEDKKYILALHYRMMPEEDVKRFMRSFNEVISAYLKGRLIRIGKGKKVIEIRPNIDFDKAKAIKLIWEKFNRGKQDITIYIGDDLTDEAVFKILWRIDVGIRVGKCETSFARYFLKDTQEVEGFLSYLSKLN